MAVTYMIQWIFFGAHSSISRQPNLVCFRDSQFSRQPNLVCFACQITCAATDVGHCAPEAATRTPLKTEKTADFGAKTADFGANGRQFKCALLRTFCCFTFFLGRGRARTRCRFGDPLTWQGQQRQRLNSYRSGLRRPLSSSLGRCCAWLSKQLKFLACPRLVFSLRRHLDAQSPSASSR